MGRVDYLRGLKENVIMGRLIPAGTGLAAYKRLDPLVEDALVGLGRRRRGADGGRGRAKRPERRRPRAAACQKTAPRLHAAPFLFLPCWLPQGRSIRW